MQAARREAEEEASIPSNLSFVSLDSVASIPRTSFEETEHWPEDLLVVPEYSFAVDVGDRELVLSFEHDEVRGALRQSPVPPYMGQQSGGALGAQ